MFYSVSLQMFLHSLQVSHRLWLNLATFVYKSSLLHNVCSLETFSSDAWVINQSLEYLILLNRLYHPTDSWTQSYKRSKRILFEKKMFPCGFLLMHPNSIYVPVPLNLPKIRPNQPNNPSPPKKKKSLLVETVAWPCESFFFICKCSLLWIIGLVPATLLIMGCHWSF